MIRISVGVFYGFGFGFKIEPFHILQLKFEVD